MIKDRLLKWMPLLALIFVVCAAGVTQFDVIQAPEIGASDFKLGKTETKMDQTGRIVSLMRNKSGSTISAGRVVEFDTVAVKIGKVTGSVALKDTNVTGSFDLEGAPNGFRLRNHTGAATNDTVAIFGDIINGPDNIVDGFRENISLGTTTVDTFMSSYVWTDFDSMIVYGGGSVGVDSVTVWIQPFRGITIGAATTLMPAGISLEAIADNAVGEICIFGEAMVKAKTASNTFLRPGLPCIVGGAGTAIPLPLVDRSVDSLGKKYQGKLLGYSLGVKDDISDTGTIWIMFTPR